ncbi:hypothetical protein REC12_22925 [Desulfosporosinus sp. PR]|uniref:hypothetical protein n=1 Tax=Candidatus Desulfosporosinus nitrosoreducens TaxID=3401928 RepID=UPI0027F51EA5|nr:hypothetical protein [Desulfosporosinus sp. PR]MDQ7096454.1 hypothetical protein [Desulfosporosinus sp. PR]
MGKVKELLKPITIFKSLLSIAAIMISSIVIFGKLAFIPGFKLNMLVQFLLDILFFTIGIEYWKTSKRWVAILIFIVVLLMLIMNTLTFMRFLHYLPR